LFSAIPVSRRAVWAAALALCALAGLTLSGGVSHASPAHAGAVYTISNATGGNQVLAFDRAPDGTLSPAGAFDSGGTGNGASLGSQGALALSDDGRYLVAVNAGSGSISLFRVSRNGLDLLDTVSSHGSVPVSVTIDGDLVYVVNDGGDNIAGFRIDHGFLEFQQGSVQPLPSGAAPGQISFDARGRNLLVTIKNTNQIVSFPVDTRGFAQAGTAVSSAAATPFGFAIDRQNHALVSEAPGSDVSSYDVGRDGTVTLIDGPVANGQAAACWVVLSKDGKFAFSSNAGNNTISTYRVAPDGSITLVQAVAGNTVGGPQDLAVSRDGRYLYAVSRASHTITEFAVNADGTLSSIGSISDLTMDSANGLVAR
jgi:6-phosphogluconolactonase (cycloisomerase 2 family)